jgi:hypothetical protein
MFQEQGALLGGINRAMPTMTNVSAFVHESVYPALGAWSSLPTQLVVTLPVASLILPFELAVRYNLLIPPSALQVGDRAAAQRARATATGTSSQSALANASGQGFGFGYGAGRQFALAGT